MALQHTLQVVLCLLYYFFILFELLLLARKSLPLFIYEHIQIPNVAFQSFNQIQISSRVLLKSFTLHSQCLVLLSCQFALFFSQIIVTVKQQLEFLYILHFLKFIIVKGLSLHKSPTQITLFYFELLKVITQETLKLL